jgi:SAM-dependent methyltransferase
MSLSVAYSLLQFHEWCTRDPVAMQAYRDAIQRVVQAGDVVLDLGAGIGILGFHAWAAGAARVYAIECSDIVNLIPRIAAANGFDNRIIACGARSFDVSINERADVAIASMLDSFGINNNLLECVLDVRKRLLKPGGSLIPSAIQMSYCPIELQNWYSANVDCWNEPRCGIDFAPARSVSVNQIGATTVTTRDLLAAPGSIDEISLLRMDSANLSSQKTFWVERPGTFHGLAGWVRITMAEDICCSNSPLDSNRLPWANAVLPVEWPVAVEPGDRIEAGIRVNSVQRDQIWTWTVRVCNAAGQIKADFKHSTFKGLLLRKMDLTVRGAAFVPRLSTLGGAELAVLTHCDGATSLGRIAEIIHSRFPHLFESPAEAQSFAASVLYRSNGCMDG